MAPKGIIQIESIESRIEAVKPVKYEEDSFSHTDLTAIRPNSMDQSCPFVLIHLLLDHFFGGGGIKRLSTNVVASLVFP